MPANDVPAPAAVAAGGGFRRFRAELAYDGTRYHGWARQPAVITVEGAVATALARILSVAEIDITCAGRTDAGVHAAGQVIHFDAADRHDPRRLRTGLNAVLPPDIRCRAVEVAPADFDARFGALWRRYRYRVTDQIPDPLARHSVLATRASLDADAMHAAVQPLLGQHDFGSFCKPRAGATTVREVLEVGWQRAADGVVVLDIRADAFCHSMVRSIVGASLAVGAGRRPSEWLAELLRAASRDAAAPVAPPHGLVLMEVGYPAPEHLAARVARTRRTRAPLRGP